MPAGVAKSKAEAEVRIRRLMREPLAVHTRLVLQADRLCARAVEANAAGPKSSEASAVCTLLLVRATNDLRCMLGLVRRGYLLQSWSLGTSLIEASVSIGYVRADPARARAWLTHADLTRSPWSVRKATSETARGFGHQTLADTLYKQFQYLSVAKHGNPALLRQYGVSRATAGGSRIQLDPHHSPGLERLLKTGMNIAVRFHSLGLACFVRDHVPDIPITGRLERYSLEVADL